MFEDIRIVLSRNPSGLARDFAGVTVLMTILLVVLSVPGPV